jgi:hypothetical protein
VSAFTRLIEFPECVESAEHALGDPRTSCFRARRSLGLMDRWAFKHDQTLRMPYHADLSALAILLAPKRQGVPTCSSRRANEFAACI